MTDMYSRDDEKDALLQEQRGFGFAEIVAALEASGLLDDIDHPSPNYPNQRILYVAFNGYAVAVPYVSDDETKFLKTAFYDRRTNKKYLNQD